MYIDVLMLTNKPAENAHALMQGKSGSEFVVANTLANDKSWSLTELTFTPEISINKLYLNMTFAEVLGIIKPY